MLVAAFRTTLATAPSPLKRFTASDSCIGEEQQEKKERQEGRKEGSKEGRDEIAPRT